jgi:hypothetical protein
VFSENLKSPSKFRACVSAALHPAGKNMIVTISGDDVMAWMWATRATTARRQGAMRLIIARQKDANCNPGWNLPSLCSQKALRVPI